VTAGSWSGMIWFRGRAFTRLTGTRHAIATSSGTTESLDNCVNGTPGPADIACADITFQCQGIDDQACITDAHNAAAQLQTFLIGLQQNPARSKLAAQDRQVQGELDQADTNLITLTDALQCGDAAKVALAETDSDWLSALPTSTSASW
jgi:hypothetical protein